MQNGANKLVHLIRKFAKWKLEYVKENKRVAFQKGENNYCNYNKWAE
jgi:hypothetical protein